MSKIIPVKDIRVTIGKSEWLVKNVSNLTVNQLCNSKAKKKVVAYGCTCEWSKTIYMNGEIVTDYNYYIEVLKHEMTHAIIAEYGYKVKKDFDEETLCDFMASYAEKLEKVIKEYLKKSGDK